MQNKKRITEIVFEVIDDLNKSLPKDQRLENSINTVLFGKSGQLDSLGLVNLIVATEQKIEEELDITLTLADEKAMSLKNSPFKTVETLIDYICTLLEEKL